VPSLLKEAGSHLLLFYKELKVNKNIEKLIKLKKLKKN
jgi:hypothetical protein